MVACDAPHLAQPLSTVIGETLSSSGRHAIQWGRLGGSRGHQIYWRCYPVAHAQSAIVMLHGYGEHGRRFHKTAIYLQNLGHNVIIYDQRGHGLSQGFPGVIGSQDLLLEDCDAMMTWAAQSFPHSKRFILGQGSGAITAGLWQATSPKCSGIILSAPLSHRYWRPRFVGKSFVISRVLPRIALTPPGILKSRVRNKGLQVQYRTDPFYHANGVRAQAGFELARGAYRLRNRANKLSGSSLILYGSDDPLLKRPEIEEFYNLIGHTDKTLKFYTGFRHDLLLDFGWRQIANDLSDWINARVPT